MGPSMGAWCPKQTCHVSVQQTYDSGARLPITSKPMLSHFETRASDIFDLSLKLSSRGFCEVKDGQLVVIIHKRT
jgi:hypothetical protein